MNYFITLGITTLAIGSALQAYAETEQLEQINVEGKAGTSSGETAKKTFTQAKAVSVKEDLYQSTQNLDSVVRSMPGAFTQQDKSSGVLSINIRGESGFGRANALIDGVPQTFYATAADAKGRAGGNSQFGANIDSNFIADVELERGSFSGKSGINSLYGAANFRTLGVNDVVKNDRNWGLLVKGLTGSNATKPNYMATAAYRLPLDNGGYFGVLYGYSYRKVSQDYRYGGGEFIKNAGANFLAQKKRDYFVNQAGIDFINGKWVDLYGWHCNKYRCDNIDDVAAKTEKAWQENEVHQFQVQPLDPDTLRQRSRSHLAKIEYVDEHNALNLQFRTLENYVAGRTIDSKNYQLDYQFTHGDYLDLHVLLAHNVNKQKYARFSQFSGKTVRDYLEVKNVANLLDINNTFTFALPKNAELKTTLGFNLLHNDYQKNRFPYELGLFYGAFKHGAKALLPEYSVTLQPSGKQKFLTGYLDNSLRYDIWHLGYSANITKYNFRGEVSDFYPAVYIRDVLGKNSPQFKQACKIDPETKIALCDNYEPITQKSGKAKHAINQSALLSADIHPLFMPFATYAVTHRMPNIQEMYFSQISNLGVNTELKPERAQTVQLGVNGFTEGLLREDDVFGFKILGYRSRIKNYIHNVYSFWDDPNKFNHYNMKPDWAQINGPRAIIHYQNYAGTVRKKGIEMELSYDMGKFYVNLAYAYQKTNQPTNFSDASTASSPNLMSGKLQQGYGLSKISMLPRDYGRIDFGSRWFDKKLTLGTTMRYYGKSKRANLERINIGQKNTYDNYLRTKYIRGTETIEKQPLIWDFYLIYEPVTDLIIKAELQNAFDKKYIDPLDSNNDSANQRFYTMFDEKNPYHSVLNNWARGRTFVLSMSYKF